jgi:hypothetical protein
LRSRIRPLDAALLVIGALATVEAVYLSQYLIWTHVGLDRIDGPQGRYLLPIIPMLVLALPRLPLPGARFVRPALFAATILAACADNVVLPVMMITLFHTS